MRRAVVTIALAATASASTPARALELSDVLARLDAFLTRYESSVAAVIAEERYEQVMTLARADAPRVRVLRSDYALARSAGGHAWTGYRDVFEVDGRPVRDGPERLLALLEEGSAGAAREALRVTRENARFNLGEEMIPRTINVPTIVLDLIHPRHRPRMAFRKTGEALIGDTLTWEVRFEERRRGTILRTAEGRDRRSHGSVWLDPESGAVLRTELSWDGEPRGSVRVQYRRDAAVDVPVPGTMTEEYRAARLTITGTATYTNYRRFQTDARILSFP